MFAGLGSAWDGMAATLWNIDTFRATLMECFDVARERGVCLDDAMLHGQPSVFSCPKLLFASSVAFQLAAFDVVAQFGLKWDFCIGHSMGECVAAYACGHLSRKETIKLAIAIGAATTHLPRGIMAAVALSPKRLRPLLPTAIDIVCYNGPASTTIASSRVEDLVEFVEKLKAAGIKGAIVPSADVALHNAAFCSALQRTLGKTLPVFMDHINERRSEKWYSTLPRCQPYVNSEYFIQALTVPVAFSSAIVNLPPDTQTVEFSPSAILSGLLYNIRKDLKPPIKLFGRDVEDSKQRFVEAMSKLGREELLDQNEGIELDLKYLLYS